MVTTFKEIDTDVALALRGARAARRAAAHAPVIAVTGLRLVEAGLETGDGAPPPLPVRAPRPATVLAKPVARSPMLAAGAPARSDSAAMLAAWSTARWVEEQEALAAAAARRAAASPARHTPDVRASARRVAREAARRPGNWLLRFEAALDRLLPGAFGSLLGLFLCVTLSMALISSMLPIVDRL